MKPLNGLYLPLDSHNVLLLQFLLSFEDPREQNIAKRGGSKGIVHSLWDLESSCLITQ